jgi:N-acetylmuramoyl-L-alanine amidase
LTSDRRDRSDGFDAEDRWGSDGVFGRPATPDELLADEKRDTRRRRRVLLIGVALVLVAAAGGAVAVAWPDDHQAASASATHDTPTVAASRPPEPTPEPGRDLGAPAPELSSPTPAPPQSAPPTPAGAASKTPGTAPVPPPRTGAGNLPLSGRVVVIDPGHNPGNGKHSREINTQVDAGGMTKECDTTGTETNKGYTEAEFTLDLAARARKHLEQQGATVLYTWESDPWGPCVNERAAKGNAADADAVVSIHADGGPAGGRGFHVILPAPVRAKNADTAPILAPSRELGTSVAKAFSLATETRPASYLDTDGGLVTRSDLGGLNLSTRPKVFIECANMRNAADAALITDPNWRERAASGIAAGITAYLQKGT